MDDLLELISASLDGALSPDQEARLEAWLDQHPEDRLLRDQLAQTSAALRDLPPVEVPDHLTDRILTALPRKKPLPWGRWLAAAALVCLVLAGGYSFTRQQENTAATLSAPAVAQEAPEEGVTLFSVQEETTEEAAMDVARAEKNAPAAAALPEALPEPPLEVWDRVREGLDPADELEFQGLSPNGLYWVFLWTREGQTTRCAAPLDGSPVVWEGEGEDFRALLEHLP